MVRIRAFLFSVITLLVSSSVMAGDKPNIIVMVADDLGWADVGFHGNQVIETPSLDRIAAEGAQLNRFYTTPICSPTRAALMTGRDPIRLGVAYSTIMPWHNNGIHPEETFLPELFLDAGYQTAMVGKWHLGHAQQSYHPNARGFEHFYGHLHTEVGFTLPLRAWAARTFSEMVYRLMTRAMKVSCWPTKSVATLRSEIKRDPFSSTCPLLRHTRHSTRQKTCRRSTLTCPMSAASHVAKWPTTHALWRK